MEKKKSILFKELDVVFVYLFIFLVGIAFVLSIVRYLDYKVNDIADTMVLQNN